MIKKLIKPINKVVLGSALGFAIISATYAAEFNAIDASQSNINFKYQQMGVSMDGKFEKFDADISFAPENADQGSVKFQVELASVDTGTSDGNDEVVKNTWFNVNDFPVATFNSNKIEKTGDNNYLVSGVLNIKGNEIETQVPATFIPADNGGNFTGEFTINRGDFNIGEGAWSTFEIVANPVIINFSIFALTK